MTSDGAGAGQDIHLYGLSVHYGRTRALDDIDLHIAPGQFLTLLGPSGSGKSTLLMALAGFIQPTHGDIFVGGTSIVGLAPEKRDFGVVFQGYALFPHMSVAENVAYPLKVRRLKRSDIDAKVREALELVQLGQLAGRMPRQLSGGQQQRVALARALVFSPKVLLLDEPMGALDKKLRHELQFELRQLHRRLGRTFVNVTHDQEEAMAMSDCIAIMRSGRIEQLGVPRALYERPATRFVADFLGKSNFIEGRVKEVAAGIAEIDTPDGLVRHALGEQIVVSGSEILLALRPQKLLLGVGPNSRSATVEAAIFLGTHAEVTLRCNSGLQLGMNLAVSSNAVLPIEGTTVEVNWDMTSTTSVSLAPSRERG